MVAATQFDVLCVGHASYDLVFDVPVHPQPDEKIFADELLACGGGPAANAAVLVARLGYHAAFAGYLGDDLYGDRHLQELEAEGVDTSCILRGTYPTPLSVILVKPDGSRTLVNHKGLTKALAGDALDFSGLRPKVILFDGHEPQLSLKLAAAAKPEGIVTVLDAGSLHEGTQALMGSVDYLVASEKFAQQWLGRNAPLEALAGLSEFSPNVIITLGEQGVVWKNPEAQGALPAFPIVPVDTTGAGDAFHGAFAAGLAEGLPWRTLLEFASAAGAWCCLHKGARPGMAKFEQLQAFLLAHGA